MYRREEQAFRLIYWERVVTFCFPMMATAALLSLPRDFQMYLLMVTFSQQMQERPLLILRLLPAMLVFPGLNLLMEFPVLLAVPYL